MTRHTTALAIALTVFGSVACNAKMGEGGSCEANENCKQGLVCVANQCTESKKAARARARNLQKKAERHMHDSDGQCPTIADLGEPMVTNDPWGKPYAIKCPSEHSIVDLVSAGPDGTFETPDDLASWDE